jgi:signal transduction histidine kinase
MAAAFADVVYAASTLSLPTLFPYAFLVYAFCIADTLIVRYRNASGELERTAQELRQTTNELTHSYLELSAVQEELFKKRQLASVGELAGSIAHEVRNPLAIIRNAAASLRRPSVGAEDKTTLFVIIEEEITRLNNLVSELLRFARPVNVHRESISIVEVLKSLTDRVKGAERLEMRFPTDPDMERVYADANLLKLALGNLIENAIQASSDAGQVTVTVAQTSTDDGPGVQVDISDTGHGMDEETCRRARDPFFSTRPSGTGLGLPIAMRIVEAHGGTLELASRPGEGTIVTVRIPSKGPERLSEPRISTTSTLEQRPSS